MSYRCEVCEALAPPDIPLRRHTIFRKVVSTRIVWETDECGKKRPAASANGEREEIEREIPVCKDCAIALEGGTPLNRLIYERRPKIVLTPAPLTPETAAEKQRRALQDLFSP